MLLMMQGMPDEALRHLERSLELDPDQPERERVLDVVETLRSQGIVTTQPQAPATASGPS
jgi:hypothetical protein